MSETQQVQNAPSGESFAALFEAAQKTAQEHALGGEGQIVTGIVVRVSRDFVIVDIGGKSEGVLAKDEFIDAHGEVHVKPGDRVDVFIESRESDEGLISLSKEKADKMKVWDEISLACERDEIIEGTISQHVKGGLSVTIRGGVKAFLPGSQVDLRPIRNLEKLIGQTYEFKVIKFNKKRGNIVLSRRVLLEKERDQMKQQTLKTLEEGQVLQGTIKNLTEYGAFVDLGGIDGLLHITDMSWGRVNHPSEVFNVGDEVTVKVLKYNSETERVSLGLKQTQEDPWNMASAQYTPGTKVKGKVVSLTDYGAFVELEQGVEGLIHVSEMTWTKPKHPSKILELGQEVETVVLDVDAQNKRISLGLKQLEADPWSIFTEKYNPGDIIQGKVRSLTDYGVFVGIEEGVDGMVHKSDLSWTQRINNPADFYRKGDEVEAIILSINHEEKKVSLGIKQLYEDPWSYIPTRYPEGTTLEVRVIAADEDGARVELEQGVEGYVPRGEISADMTVEPEDVLKAGEIIAAQIVRLDEDDRLITLSLRAAEGSEMAEDMKFEAKRKDTPRVDTSRKAGPSKAGAGAILGDLLKGQLGGLKVGSEESSDESSEDAGDE